MIYLTRFIFGETVEHKVSFLRYLPRCRLSVTYTLYSLYCDSKPSENNNVVLSRVGLTILSKRFQRIFHPIEWNSPTLTGPHPIVRVKEQVSNAFVDTQVVENVFLYY